MHLESPGCRAVVDPEQGGRLTSLVVDGRELIVDHGSDVFHWGSFPMAPWVGRLRNGRLVFQGQTFELPLNAPPHALHGLVTSIPWHEVGPGVVAVELPEPWPWRGRVKQSMALGLDRLDFRLELDADEPMPAALGWHPWFRTHVDGPAGDLVAPIELEVTPGRMYENDAEGLPNGALVVPVPRPWDYCFTDLAGPPVVRWPGFLELTVESTCLNWVFYVGKEPQGLCVEPWTAPPNSLNMPSPSVVVPGAPLVATMTWRWRRLGEPAT